MKTWFKFLGIITIAVVIGFSVVSCSSSGSGSTSPTSTPLPPVTGGTAADRSPSTAVATTPAQIPDFEGKEAMSNAEFADFKASLSEEFEGLGNDLLGGGFLNVQLSNLASSYSRKLVTESDIIYLSELFDMMDDEEKAGIRTMNGYLRYAASYNDGDDPFPLTANGDAKFFIETSETGISDSDFGKVIGSIAGNGSVSNVRIVDENNISGTINFAVNYAANLLTEEDKWVKVIGDIKANSNLSTGSMSATATMKAYGDAELGNIKVTINITPENVSVIVE